MLEKVPGGLREKLMLEKVPGELRGKLMLEIVPGEVHGKWEIDVGKSAWPTAWKIMLEKMPGEVRGKLMLENVPGKLCGKLMLEMQASVGHGNETCVTYLLHISAKSSHALGRVPKKTYFLWSFANPKTCFTLGLESICHKYNY